MQPAGRSLGGRVPLCSKPRWKAPTSNHQIIGPRLEAEAAGQTPIPSAQAIEMLPREILCAVLRARAPYDPDRKRRQFQIPRPWRARSRVGSAVLEFSAVLRSARGRTRKRSAPSSWISCQCECPFDGTCGAWFGSSPAPPGQACPRCPAAAECCRDYLHESPPTVESKQCFEFLLCCSVAQRCRRHRRTVLCSKDERKP